MNKNILLILFLFTCCFLFSQNINYCQQGKNQQGSIVANSQLIQANNSRSDTIDVLKYTITLEITDFTNKIIQGNTRVLFKAKQNNVSTLQLDLLKLTIDSIVQGQSPLSYLYDDTLITISLNNTLAINDTNEVVVYYHGSPKTDASGWGGFYFQSGYAFNLGVGFEANPHNYGRVWFPCFDNFVERSQYEFHISTNNGRVAYCNGTLKKDSIDVNGLRTRTWIIEEEIPSYLASVAVAPYVEVKRTYLGIADTVPIVLAAVAADTVNLKNSFVNLNSALSTFENRYGPYLWNRVGYCLVPFSSGAMEHATNIAYPKFAVNGSLTYQTLMAHELSHHWWGDLATCETAEDMWINEGMAAYSEHLFTEGLSGKTAYDNSIRINHEYVLHYAHIKEGGYLPVSGISHDYTYGDHVYLKGADVAHTMRGYLGDSLFFVGLKHIQSNYRYTHISSIDFRNAMTIATGVNMNDFFTNWIFNPGFPHFSVDSFVGVTANGFDYDVTVYLKQKLTGAPNYYSNVPLEISFRDNQWNTSTKKTQVSGQYATASFTIPFQPSFVGLNLDEKISMAIAPEKKLIKTNGVHNFSNARMNITVSNISDSAFLLVEHNYTAPDNFKQPQPIRLSPNRYWKVSGTNTTVLDASARINYDGRAITTGGNGYLDHQLLVQGTSEDSIVLLYRKNTMDDWAVFPYYTKTIGVPTDKFGSITIDSLLFGEYVLGINDYFVGISKPKEKLTLIQLKPNPANETVSITHGSNFSEPIYYTARDLTGKLIQPHTLLETITNEMSTRELPNGIYLFSFFTKKEFIQQQKLVIVH